MDQGGGAGDVINIDALNQDLILHGLGLDGLGGADHVDDTDDLLAEKVLDFDTLSTVNDVAGNREMRVHQSHVVTVFLRDTHNHVVHMRADRSQGGDLLGETEEEGDFELLATIDLGDRDREVVEVTGESALLSLDDDLSGFHRNLHTLRDGDLLLALDILHFVSFSTTTSRKGNEENFIKKLLPLLVP